MEVGKAPILIVIPISIQLNHSRTCAAQIYFRTCEQPPAIRLVILSFLLLHQSGHLSAPPSRDLILEVLEVSQIGRNCLLRTFVNISALTSLIAGSSCLNTLPDTSGIHSIICVSSLDLLVLDIFNFFAFVNFSSLFESLQNHSG